MTATEKYFNKLSPAAPLAVFRIGFGFMLLASIVRFWQKGWITDLYVTPKYFFNYYGFEFIKPLGSYTYILFIICGLAALLVAIGLFYRFAAVCLFLSFTYIELIDKTTYLNHYYFISLVCFLLIFLPAQVCFSVDAFRKGTLKKGFVPQWNVDVLKLMMAIVYIFAGLAKINSDWLIHAQPLKIWLPAHNDMPFIGFLFNYDWIPFVFSWFGCLYDLSIPFFLWQNKTRPFAYFAVIVFHILTAILFPIGMFPHIMIVAALIFFSAEFHQKVLQTISKFLHFSPDLLTSKDIYSIPRYRKWIFMVFFAFQLLVPFRYLLYPCELFWTEEGYRFSWRVMLMEKTGYTQFTIKDSDGKQMVVNNNHFLTTLQEKMMSTQADMILQYAHILEKYYAKNGFNEPQVYVDSYVSLNGRLGKPLVSPTVDLAKQKESFFYKQWITPFNDNIKGF
ncbi:HTTM domain-containing protein [Lacihabitans sp. CCS-44]|uniref:HTTM domain-containing protein n=1 Tax=Lacihabitans sp. CCS-44 TaxID=2487331 RepID=UPI0020CC12AB|nr:HTTM domain-containing protein [Lacihabitans sp. CCS-44]MCP9755128.1 HTTM domain-containing protein [Lacihabitans sp. CCS-44]